MLSPAVEGERVDKDEAARNSEGKREVTEADNGALSIGPQHTAARCSALQRTAAHCTALQHNEDDGALAIERSVVGEREVTQEDSGGWPIGMYTEYIYTYVYAYIYACSYLYLYMYVYIFINPYIYIYVCIYVSMYINMYLCISI